MSSGWGREGCWKWGCRRNIPVGTWGFYTGSQSPHSTHFCINHFSWLNTNNDEDNGAELISWNAVTQSSLYGDIISVHGLLLSEEAQIYSKLLTRILAITAIKSRKKSYFRWLVAMLHVEMVFKHFLEHFQLKGENSLLSRVTQFNVAWDYRWIFPMLLN